MPTFNFYCSTLRYYSSPTKRKHSDWSAFFVLLWFRTSIDPSSKCNSILIGGRLRVLPVADETSNKEWQSSKKTSKNLCEVWLANDNRATLGSAFLTKVVLCLQGKGSAEIARLRAFPLALACESTGHIVFFNPSGTSCHLPLHKGGFYSSRTNFW